MTMICRLPGPVADLWDWQFEGSCRRENPDVFFHPDCERGPSRRNRDRAAKAVCLDCPVLQSCRRHALAVREPYGVWGGMTECEREEVQVASTSLPTVGLRHTSLEYLEALRPSEAAT
jgi:WhiB family redox-sensing transcriptional regulator